MILTQQLHDAQCQLQQATAAAKLHEEQSKEADTRFRHASAEALRIRLARCIASSTGRNEKLASTFW